MVYNYTVEDAVSIELNEAIEHYNKISIELAQDLSREFFSEINSIIKNPYHFATISKPYRKASLKRFPYKVIFRIDIDMISIVALAHHKRKPNYWKPGSRPFRST